MKITRQLRFDLLAADGTASVHLTISWEGNRLRMGTGTVVRPEHWDAEHQQVKVQRGTPHDSVNPRLNRAHEAAAEAQQAATKQGRRLPKEELKAAVESSLPHCPVAESAPLLPQQRWTSTRYRPAGSVSSCTSHWASPVSRFRLPPRSVSRLRASASASTPRPKAWSCACRRWIWPSTRTSALTCWMSWART